jgi:hypothetical protein
MRAFRIRFGLLKFFWRSERRISEFFGKRWLELLTLIAVLNCQIQSLLNIGIVAADTAFERSLNLHELLQVCVDNARLQGRIFMFLTPLSSIFQHGVRSFEVYQASIIFPFLSNVICTSWLAFEATGSSLFSWLMLLAGVATAQIMWNFHGLAAYPGLFSLTFSATILSMIAIKRSVQKESLPLNIGGSVILFASLCVYEMFFPYILLIPVLLASGFKSRNSPPPSGPLGAENRAEYIRYATPPILAILAYLSLYFSFRHFFASVYDGNRLNISDLGAILGVLKKMLLSALPGYAFLNAEPAISGSASIALQQLHHPFALLSSLRPAEILGATLFSILVFVALKKAQQEKAFPREAFLAGGILTIAPLLVVSFSQKYQYLFSHGRHTYIGAYYAQYGVLFLFILTLIALAKLGRKSSWIRTPGAILCATAAGFSVALTFTSNRVISADMRPTQTRFRIVDHLLETKAFEAIPANALLFSPDLFAPAGELAISSPRFWTQYIKKYTNKDLLVSPEWLIFSQQMKAQKPTYILRILNETRSGGYAFAVAKVENYSTSEQDRVRFFSDDFTVFRQGFSEKTKLFSADFNSSCPKKKDVFIDGERFIPASAKLEFLRFDETQSSHDEFHVRTCPIDVESIALQDDHEFSSSRRKELHRASLLPEPKLTAEHATVYFHVGLRAGIIGPPQALGKEDLPENWSIQARLSCLKTRMSEIIVSNYSEATRRGFEISITPPERSGARKLSLRYFERGTSKEEVFTMPFECGSDSFLGVNFSATNVTLFDSLGQQTTKDILAQWNSELNFVVGARPQETSRGLQSLVEILISDMHLSPEHVPSRGR